MQEFKKKSIVNCNMTKELTIDEIRGYKKNKKYLIERGSFYVSSVIIEAGCFYFILGVSMNIVVRIFFSCMALIYLWGLIRDIVTEYKIRTSVIKVQETEGLFVALQRGFNSSCVVEYNEEGNTRKKVIEEPVFIGEKVNSGDHVRIISEPNYTYILKY